MPREPPLTSATLSLTLSSIIAHLPVPSPPLPQMRERLHAHSHLALLHAPDATAPPAQNDRARCLPALRSRHLPGTLPRHAIRRPRSSLPDDGWSSPPLPSA